MGDGSAPSSNFTPGAQPFSPSMSTATTATPLESDGAWRSDTSSADNWSPGQQKDQGSGGTNRHSGGEGGQQFRDAPQRRDNGRWNGGGNGGSGGNTGDKRWSERWNGNGGGRGPRWNGSAGGRWNGQAGNDRHWSGPAGGDRWGGEPGDKWGAQSGPGGNGPGGTQANGQASGQAPGQGSSHGAPVDRRGMPGGYRGYGDRRRRDKDDTKVTKTPVVVAPPAEFAAAALSQATNPQDGDISARWRGAAMAVPAAAGASRMPPTVAIRSGRNDRRRRDPPKPAAVAATVAGA